MSEQTMTLHITRKKYIPPPRFNGIVYNNKYYCTNNSWRGAWYNGDDITQLASINDKKIFLLIESGDKLEYFGSYSLSKSKFPSNETKIKIPIGVLNTIQSNEKLGWILLKQLLIEHGQHLTKTKHVSN